MKALLIAETDSAVHFIARYIQPYGFDIIRYRSAVKALDNVDEIAPDALFISAVDFPRHWKTLVQFIRADAKYADAVIVLLTGERFGQEDADKALKIGVQAIISDNPGAEDETRLERIFSRYQPSLLDESWLVHTGLAERAAFLFTNPRNDTIVTGKVDGLGPSELRFRPDAPSSVADLSPDETLDQCSLKLDGTILAPVCRVRKNGNVMILEMTGLDKAGQRVISDFISEAR